jgi:hypothetical protein
MSISGRKEVKTMKYETPELTALTPAINAIQAVKQEPPDIEDHPTLMTESSTGAYQDWE